MKQLALSLLFAIVASTANAQVDYSKMKQTNPYARYEYKSAEEWREIRKQELAAQEALSKQNINPNQPGVDYFSKNSINPLTAAQTQKATANRKKSPTKNKGAYANLIDNQHRIGQCWDQAAITYKVDPWLLMAIAKTESSFNPNAVNRANKNGSTDYGLMQINTYWLKTLKKHNIEKEHLFDPCVSIFVGAWILSENIKRLGYNVDGIGAYNSPNKATRRKYAAKVYENYRILVRDLYQNQGKK